MGRTHGVELIQNVQAAIKKRQLLATPVNVIAGVVFPDPDDPRWHIERLFKKTDKPECKGRFAYVLGNVWAFQELGNSAYCEVIVGKNREEESWTYYNDADCTLEKAKSNYFYAIDKAYIQRESFRSIEAS